MLTCSIAKLPAFAASESNGTVKMACDCWSFAQVSVAVVDSHDLFRNTREVKAVVVCMKGGDYLPFPSQLATSLRGQQSFEDDWEGR